MSVWVHVAFDINALFFCAPIIPTALPYAGQQNRVRNKEGDPYRVTACTRTADQAAVQLAGSNLSWIHRQERLGLLSSNVENPLLLTDRLVECALKQL